MNREMAMPHGNDTGAQALRAEMKQLQTDIAKLGETLRNTAYASGAATIERAKIGAGNAWSEVKGKTQGLTQEIEEKPLTAVLSAFSIGVLLGMIFGSRRA
jgi:ElaB/YqjD/DUF883 family membrane-anchored ribosome-binding protein